MAKSIDLIVKIITDAKGAAKGLHEAQSGFEKFSGGVETASMAAATALGAIKVAAIANVKAAAEEAQSQAMLTKALRTNTSATDAQIAANEAHLSAMARSSGVADEQLRPAMGALARATGDVETSEKALAVALDVSAATGKDFSAVTQALAKGFAGNTKAIGKLIPGLDQATVESGDMNAIMAELAATTGGASATAANTAAGQFAILQIAMQDTKEAAGVALLPMLEKLTATLMDAATWVGENQEQFSRWVKGIAGVSAAIIALNIALKIGAVVGGVYGFISKRIAAGKATEAAATTASTAAVTTNTIAYRLSHSTLVTWLGVKAMEAGAWLRSAAASVASAVRTGLATAATLANAAATKVAAVAQRMWNAAMKANPIGLVITAVMALVAAIIWLWNNCEWFRDFVMAMWEGIKVAATAVANVVKAVWGVVWSFLSAKVTMWMNIARAAFNAVKAVATVVANVIKAIWNVAMAVIGAKVRLFSNIAKAAFNAVRSVASSVANFVRSVWDRTFGALASAASGLGAKLSAPFNAMKSAISSAIGMVNDLISRLRNIKVPKISLPKGATFSLPPAPAVAGTKGVPTAGTRSTSTGPTIVIQGAIDPEATARQIRRILAAHDRRTGGLTGAGLRTGLV